MRMRMISYHHSIQFALFSHSQIKYYLCRAAPCIRPLFRAFDLRKEIIIKNSLKWEILAQISLVDLLSR